jgi:CheY-like chemotaxis protein
LDKQATTRSIVSADPTQIHQVLINLCTNAAHAMEEDGGKLEIRLDNICLDEEYAETIPNLMHGDYLKISISDTGIGIPPDIIGQIFEPYFTTKSKGKGNGLGLAVVHGIVKSHDGHITVYSEPGKGTTFTVYLPLITEIGESVAEQSGVTIFRGNERILFVDDEASIVKMQFQSLGRLGYKVFSTTSSIEALDTFKKAPHDFDLVITDMTMPEMTGDRLAAEIKKIRPDIPIILCTGFSGKTMQHESAELHVNKLLMKPVDKAQMSEAIREVLDKAKDCAQ